MKITKVTKKYFETEGDKMKYIGYEPWLVCCICKRTGLEIYEDKNSDRYSSCKCGHEDNI